MLLFQLFLLSSSTCSRCSSSASFHVLPLLYSLFTLLNPAVILLQYCILFVSNFKVKLRSSPSTLGYYKMLHIQLTVFLLARQAGFWFDVSLPGGQQRPSCVKRRTTKPKWISTLTQSLTDTKPSANLTEQPHTAIFRDDDLRSWLLRTCL